jgi:threonine synthase
MRYVSTRGAAPVLGFDDVLLEGLAVDGGLYVPQAWPRLDRLPDPALGYAHAVTAVLAPFVNGSVVGDSLPALAEATYRRFRHPEVAPLRPVGEGLHLLELFWGPTLSFKDYALQLVGRLFDQVLAARGRRILVLAATSGDTGSAAIEACRDRAAIDVVVLYPEGRVSEVQRRQMTTVTAANVRAVAVEGTFDDCQDLVKEAFADAGTRERFRLAAVNSINWARIVAQAAYYVWTAARLREPFAVSVPTGNFGNVFAAYVAREAGAPIERLIVANNANHGLSALIEGGRMVRSPVVPTLAPAMDIQVPSNLERYLFELLGRDGAATAGAMAHFRAEGALVLDEVGHARAARLFDAAWFDDGEVEGVIRRVHRRHGLLLDPHTATGWAAAERCSQEGLLTVAVATAHPAKFPEAVTAATGVVPALPEDLADLMDRPERTATIPRSLEALQGMLASFVR